MEFYNRNKKELQQRKEKYRLEPFRVLLSCLRFISTGNSKAMLSRSIKGRTLF